MYVISSGICGGMLMAFLIASSALLAVTVVASVLFYQRVKQAQKEYEESKGVIKNIVISFSRELSREKRRLESVEVSSLEALEKSIESLRVSEKNRSEFRNLSDDVEKTVQELVTVKSKIERLSQRKELQEDSIDKKKAPPLIPVREEGVLSRLNPTELTILEILDGGGEMSVPKMKERIGKTREHTARLLKKLYDNGFVDRNTRSMPYKYNLRKELKDLLKERGRVDLVP